MPRPNSPQLWKPKNLIFPISEYLKYWCKPINLQGAQVGWDIIFLAQFSIVQLLSCNPMDHSMPDLPVHHQLLEFTQTHLHWVGDAIQPSHPLPYPSPPAFNPSQHQGFSSESVLHIGWPEYWSFNFSISPSNKYSGLADQGLNLGPFIGSTEA